ncbi:helix-turn-helix domain-containing protein [Nonomuraea sp. NPDC003709]|uniref:TetR/AcrR family transcriptional regulator n=1 Tax=Nonomuraea sp. NPDC003709 TaxID=3154450 RepID=UPI00339E42A6
MSEVYVQALPLRERKKAMTRAAILEAAERLFEERGYDNVTVAEIADSANVSVKTLFVYFRSKEDLVFTDTWRLIDAVLKAMKNRAPSISHGQAVGEALIGALRSSGQAPGEGIEGFHRGYGQSDALRSRMLKMWADYEDRITAFLAEEAGATPTPAMRLQAIWLVGLIRSVTTLEVRAMITGLTPEQTLTALSDWLRAAACGDGSVPQS